MVRVTSARPSGGRDEVPAKTTSSILPPRSDLAPCSPMTQQRASTMLDLPDPLGPTAPGIPGSKRSVVAEAKDLNPRNGRLLRYTREHSSSLGCSVAAGSPQFRTLPLPCHRLGYVGRRAAGLAVSAFPGAVAQPIAGVWARRRECRLRLNPPMVAYGSQNE